MEIFLYLLVLVLFFFLSAVFAGFETGIISLDRFKLEQEAKKSNIKRKILHFYDHGDKTFGTTLIGSNVTNIIIAAVATTLFYHHIFKRESFYSTIIIAFVVLVFSDLIPKSMFRDFPNKLVIAFFPLINTCYILLKPLVNIVTYINNYMKKFLKIDEQNSYKAFTKDDLAFIVEQTYNEGNLQQPQKEMLEEALEFNNLIAKNVMKPRTEIVAIQDNMTYAEIMNFVKIDGYTRYPVYHETLDEITGVLIIYDLLKEKNLNLTAKEMQREIYFVPESMDVNVLLKEMQAQKKSIAIVVDAYGGTSGLVTIEDILEEIVGEIDDEYDTEEIKDVVKVNKNTWLVNGFVEVDTLVDDYDLDLPEGDYETIAGLIISTLATIPKQGQKININGYTFEIVEVTNKKIKKVRIVKKEIL
ncbi:MAG: hemolysin family protein [Candidatus Cloacimonetes bacterium]|nr:hemolysin family protein [Candidatus Cloacimonadota bacterium]